MLDRALSRLADLLVLRARRVLLICAVLVIAAGAYGFTVFGKLSAGGFDDPSSQSTRAATLLKDQFGATSPDLILVVSAQDGRTRQPAEKARSAKWLAVASGYWLKKVAPMKAASEP